MLFPMKTRCRFTKYKASKSYKFGLTRDFMMDGDLVAFQKIV